MPQSGIILRPAFVLRSRNNQVFVVDPVSLPAGRALTDWTSFTFTLREDPHWPRAWFHDAKQLDPYYDAWALKLQVTLAAASAIVSTHLEFPIAAADVDLPGGFERYAGDVRGTGGGAGETTLRDVTWCTMSPRVG